MPSFFYPRRHASSPSLGGFKSNDHIPTGRMILLGKTPLMGALTGQLAIEVCADGGEYTAKVWTLYQAEDFDWQKFVANTMKPVQLESNHCDEHTFLPYARICADTPHGLSKSNPLDFWLNPDDEITQYAGLGSQWLEPTSATPRNGLILARLNKHMLQHKSMCELQEAGLFEFEMTAADYPSNPASDIQSPS